MTQQPVTLTYDPPRDEWTITLHDGAGGTLAAVLPQSIVDDLCRQVTGGTIALPVDDTTRRLIDMAKEVQALEPPRPDLDQHTGHHLEQIARDYDQWERHLGALRLLIGVRLTNAALGT